LSELDYIQEKQTERTSESGKELDLFAYFLGICQKVWRKRCRQKRYSNTKNYIKTTAYFNSKKRLRKKSKILYSFIARSAFIVNEVNFYR